MGALAGRVAVVTGASRGIGRGIALALGEAGATVYVTGRTTDPSGSDLPGSIGATAEEVTGRGGTGVAVAVDHGNDESVAALFARVQAEAGRLDILVNNAFSLPDTLTAAGGFWEKPLSDWQMVDVGVRSSFVASWHAARIMLPRRSGLIVATSGYTGVTYTYGVVFGLAKSAVDRMARDMAVELKPHGIASLSLWLGLTFTERARRNLSAHPAMLDQDTTNPLGGSSVEFPGRVVAALAADANILRLTGGTFIAAELARDYGITDIDGSTPPSLRAVRGAPIWQPV
ncbi:MAG: SDR family NAD(P)-dependent oxidoreductase [Sandarakinorhabdus sp.]|nr:SDR family NAD(P)-dependent oxidoreductase [Sandarakinorhabdus sp.]